MAIFMDDPWPAEQHGKQHVPPIGQADVSLETLPRQQDLAADEPAFGAVAAGVGDRAPIQRARLAAYDVRRMPPGTHGEAQPHHAVAQETVQRLHVQRAAARARIELGLELGDAELRQRQPLAPAQHERIRGGRIRHRGDRARWGGDGWWPTHTCLMRGRWSG
jgi:hypothetical protein